MVSTYAESSCLMIPGLPDDIAIRILIRLPVLTCMALKLVCKKWLHFLYSDDFSELRAKFGFSESWIFVGNSGGPYSQGVPTVVAYSSQTDTWKRIPPNPQLPRGRFAAVGRKLYVIGGFMNGMNVADVHVFDIMRGRWSKGPSMNNSRSLHVVGVVGTLIIVAGGFGNEEDLHKSAEVLDTKLNKWSVVPNMCCPCDTNFIKGLTLNNEFWLIGGVLNYSAEVYNPKENKWRAIQRMGKKSMSVCIRSCVAIGGRLFSICDKNLISYNSASNEWDSCCELPNYILWQNCFEGVGCQLFAFGGTKPGTAGGSEITWKYNVLEVCHADCAHWLSSSLCSCGESALYEWRAMMTMGESEDAGHIFAKTGLML